jgi:serine/threonine protein kinase
LERHFGRYRILEPLGRTGSTQAYRAKSIGVAGFEKQVVVWRINGKGTSGGGSQETMIADAKRAAFLSHSNIAQVLDVGKDAGNCYIMTEYVTGVSLASLLPRRALSWPVVVHIAIQVASALDYAHARRDSSQNLLGIVHRGISPHRILLSTGGGVKLTGFGTTWPRREKLTEYEARYRSPEQLGGEPVDGRSDVYSLALVLRESLSSDRPIEIDRALKHALERYPEKRATAGELRDELSRALHERGEWVGPEDISASVSDSVSDSASDSVSASVSASDSVSALLSAARSLEARGALYAAIDRLEVALQPENLDPFEDVEATLALYERLGELCLRAQVGDRGAPAMIAGLDLADGVGHDDSAARLCSLLAQLLAQADRMDESREWRERARDLQPCS